MKYVFASIFMFGLMSPSLAAAPKELYGKSVTVTWSETRDEKVIEIGRIRHRTRGGEFILYVSSAGRVFNRLSYAYAQGLLFDYNGKNAQGKDTSDQIGGQSGSFENRQVSFQERSLSVLTALGGGARSLTVNFDQTFAGCSATIITGKESGSGTVKTKVHGEVGIEIVSMSTSSAYCTISAGNRFGG
jgi:hypothetical protein